MLEFCPHCGQVGALVQKEQVIICTRCGTQAGVNTPAEPVVINQADELTRQGTAARCPVCQELVELRGQLVARHYRAGAPRQLCPGSRRPPTTAAPQPPTASGKDLSALMTREAIRVVSCGKDAVPRIEELTLAYLDKRDRVRVQIDALRDILGPAFCLRDYPPALGRPLFAVWAAVAMCVVGKRHEQGGYQRMSDAELSQVVSDLQQHTRLFFT